MCDGTQINPGSLTVFIGPNNAGKTRALRDILNDLQGSSLEQVVIKHVESTRPQTFNELKESDYQSFFEPTEQGSRWQDLGADLCSQQTCDTLLRWPEGFFLLWDESKNHDDKLRNAGFDQHQIKDLFGHLFAARLVAFLRTSSRLQLLERGNLGQLTPQTLLEVLLRSEQSIEDLVHANFQEVFGTDFVLDYSELHRLRIVIGPHNPALPEHPRKLASVLTGYSPLEEQGDGMRAFLGLLIVLKAIDRPVLLIDEPETFLHPPQARKIGELIAQSTLNNRQLFVSTHSADVLRGILSVTKKETRVVRISRPGGQTRITVLNPQELTEITADPILSSARALEGLFYSCTVVVEGERDARFFQAVADRLGLPMLPYFLVAGGKQTVPKLVKEYRRLDVPVAAVVDFDVLREESMFAQLLEACSTPKKDIDRLTIVRQELEQVVASHDATGYRLKEAKHEVEQINNMLQKHTESADVLVKLRSAARKLQTVTDIWRDAKCRGRNAFPKSSWVKLAGVL